MLGSYSPSTGMALFNTRRRATPAPRDTSHGYDCPRTARDGARGGGRFGRAALRRPPRPIAAHPATHRQLQRHGPVSAATRPPAVMNPDGAAHNVLSVGMQQNGNSSCNNPARDQVNRQIAVHDKEPVDQFWVIGNPPLAVANRIGPSANHHSPAVLAEARRRLNLDSLDSLGVETSRSYSAGSKGNATLNPHSENQEAATDVAASRRYRRSGFTSVGPGLFVTELSRCARSSPRRIA